MDAPDTGVSLARMTCGEGDGFIRSASMHAQQADAHAIVFVDSQATRTIDGAAFLFFLHDDRLYFTDRAKRTPRAAPVQKSERPRPLRSTEDSILDRWHSQDAQHGL